MNRRTLLQIGSGAVLGARFLSAAADQKQNGVRRRICIGTHYEYPFGGNAWRTEWRPASAEELRDDLGVIRETGYDVVRIRVGFDSELDQVEQYLNICEEIGLDVVYGFATFFAPNWFTREHPEARVVNAEGETLGGERDNRWPRACIEWDSYRDQWRKVVGGSAERFKNHPSIIVWDVHNEPTNTCYCNRCAELFAQYLASKYANVQAMNAAWETAFESFEAAAVIPTADPNGPESHAGAWRLLQEERLESFLREGLSIIREHVTDKPVTFNVAHNLERSSDWWSTRMCDLPSVSAYLRSDAWTNSRSVTRTGLLAAINPGEPYWVMETLGGTPPKDWGNLLWTGKHLELETWSFIGKGAKAVVQYRWEPLMAENETLMYSTVDVSSNDTERCRRMSAVIKKVREFEDFLADSEPLEPQALLYLPRSHYLNAALYYPDAPFDSPVPWKTTLEGWYGLLSTAGYPTSIWTGALPQDASGKVIVVPFSEFLSGEEWDDLVAVSKTGCKVIIQLPATRRSFADRVAAKLNTLGPRFWQNDPIQVEEVETRGYNRDGWVILTGRDEGAGACYLTRVTLENRDSSKTLAKFHDNKRPAIIEAGEESWLVGAFDIGFSYDWTLRKELRQLVARWIADRGSEPKIQVEGVESEYLPLVETNVLQTGDRALVVCCNRAPYAWRIKLRISGYQPVEFEAPASETRQIYTERV